MASTLEGEIVAIAPDGDVVFSIGTPTVARLRVSSDILSRASNVFRSLLGPQFLEGSLDRSSQSPAGIALPDDDAVAMEDMCRLLHGEPAPELLVHVKADRIYKLSIVIDKYGCTERLRFHGQALILGFWDAYVGDDPKNSCLAQMAAAAYLLDQARGFCVATRHVITETNEDYSELFEADIAQVFPLPAILALSERRAAAQTKVSLELPRLGMPECDDVELVSYREQCDNWDSSYIKALCREFRTDCWPPRFQQDWETPFSRHTLETVIEFLRTQESCDRDTPSCRHTGQLERVTGSMFRDFADELEASCGGLCLRCVRGGERAAVLRAVCEAHPYCR
ncbi:hypothetical protein LTR56_021898 [Elasticomyces elasticus]|nr:hypothetical protein LTR56_021898 [Elasticomyces elasticus]KAK3630296.1 hypothetical protein LTR22_021558 [Elasticomyces elasticus]KAK4908985.1 hypothetical protein LTR49_022209 [Elasticomyces elasticus]KAK5754729.1 hypothetical protein LTS12_015140 [Elasticomyces elasticus]